MAACVLLGTGISAATARANLFKVKHLKLSFYNKLNYGLRVQSIDQVFMPKKRIIFCNSCNTSHEKLPLSDFATLC